MEEVLEDAVAFAGVSKYPARVKCALLSWMAWKDATAQALVRSRRREEDRMTREPDRRRSKPASEEEVREALYDVVDPELGIDVVNLGLIYGIHIDEANIATMDMTLTSAACPLTDVIEDQAQVRARRASSTNSGSTGSGCRRGARTRSRTTAGSSCGRSASTSERTLCGKAGHLHDRAGAFAASTRASAQPVHQPERGVRQVRRAVLVGSRRATKFWWRRKRPWEVDRLQGVRAGVGGVPGGRDVASRSKRDEPSSRSARRTKSRGGGTCRRGW